MDRNEIDQLSSKFEAVKIAMNHDKNGHVLRLAIHPDNTPEDVLRDPLGTRYFIVAVRMNDEGELVAGKGAEEGAKAIRVAAMLAKDEKFQTWMAARGYAEEISEESCASGMREYLGVTSRTELKTKAEARKRLLALRDEFLADLRQGQ